VIAGVDEARPAELSEKQVVYQVPGCCLHLQSFCCRGRWNGQLIDCSPGQAPVSGSTLHSSFMGGGVVVEGTGVRVLALIRLRRLDVNATTNRAGMRRVMRAVGRPAS
jgi:hypothetical protein